MYVSAPADRSREAAATANMLRRAAVTRVRARMGETNVPPMRHAVMKQAKTCAALQSRHVPGEGWTSTCPCGSSGKEPQRGCRWGRSEERDKLTGRMDSWGAPFERRVNKSAAEGVELLHGNHALQTGG